MQPRPRTPGDVPPAAGSPSGSDAASPLVGVDAVLAAVRAVPGVRDALIRTAADGDRTLRLDVVDGADESLVAERVAAVLAERLGVVAERVTPAGAAAEFDAPVPVDAPGRRVLLDRLTVVTGALDVTAEVSVRGGAAVGAGRGAAPAVEPAVLRAVATATLAAVEALAAGRVRCGLDQAEVVALGMERIAVAVVTLAISGRVDVLAGAAIVRGDARQAMARAVLSALNRRLDALIPDTVSHSGAANGVDSRHTGAREAR